ncbi:MAG: hypothetical protein JO235_19825 [Chroococcidiopsidaceae cyanobacterium CP_BM_RX_35]|nr:hypothetical protein [Chroococcidiopsidaceae cyanobacterium CP_BM_RX_35]
MINHEECQVVSYYLLLKAFSTFQRAIAVSGIFTQDFRTFGLALLPFPVHAHMLRHACVYA